MARVKRLVGDLKPDDKVYTPTSRHPRSLLAIDPRDPKEIKLMFLDTIWAMSATQEVEVEEG